MAVQLKVSIFTVDLDTSDDELMRVQACRSLQLRRWLRSLTKRGEAVRSVPML